MLLFLLDLFTQTSYGDARRPMEVFIDELFYIRSCHVMLCMWEFINWYLWESKLLFLFLGYLLFVQILFLCGGPNYFLVFRLLATIFNWPKFLSWNNSAYMYMFMWHCTCKIVNDFSLMFKDLQKIHIGILLKELCKKFGTYLTGNLTSLTCIFPKIYATQLWAT
jgi:hypothetical protein